MLQIIEVVCFIGTDRSLAHVEEQGTRRTYTMQSDAWSIVTAR